MRTIIIDGSSYKRISYPVFLMLKHHHKFCYVMKSGDVYRLSGSGTEYSLINEDEARAHLANHFSKLTAEIVFKQLEQEDLLDIIDLNA